MKASSSEAELGRGSLEAAERYLRLAERGFEGPASMPAGRRGQARLLLGMVRLLLARLRLPLSAPGAVAQPSPGAMAA